MNPKARSRKNTNTGHSSAAIAGEHPFFIESLLTDNQSIKLVLKDILFDWLIIVMVIGVLFQLSLALVYALGLEHLFV